MDKLMWFVILSALKLLVSGDYSQDHVLLSSFPEGILKEIISIATTGTLATFKGCKKQEIDVKGQVKFWYNNRGSPNEPTLLDPKNPKIEQGKLIQILIHGWLCNITNDGMPQLKNAYLKRYDSNVIRVDWSKYSIDLYSSSFCYAPEVAKYIAFFICQLKSALKVHPSEIHVVGHSLGAQISGLVGQEVKRQCNSTVRRITGLDPAGPLFQYVSKSRRLDASDAEFVDVIHTNQNFYGFYGSCEGADFFPNCGTYQPGCFDNSRNESITNLPLSVVHCNHVRSLDLMVESINPGKNKFVGKSCKACPGLPVVGPCVTDFRGSSVSVMGEDCSPNLNAHKFSLTTNSKSPFAKS